MNYISIKKGDDCKNLTVTLTMTEIKILHNACVDILREFPGATSYDETRQSLEDIIQFDEARLNKEPS